MQAAKFGNDLEDREFRGVGLEMLVEEMECATVVDGERAHRL